MTTTGVEDVPVLRDGRQPKAAPSTRIRVAEVLAFVGLLAALAGALGPADAVSTTYSWPPPVGAESAPPDLWYTPLLLIRHRPASISARVPCVAPPPLDRTARSVVVLATARFPTQLGGLAVLQAADELVIRVGDQLVHRTPVRRDLPPERACAYDLRLEADRWSLVGVLTASLDRDDST